MIRLFQLSFLLAALAFGSEESVAPHVSAQFGKAHTRAGHRTLYIYSKRELAEPMLAFGEGDSWTAMTKYESQEGFFVYGSAAPVKIDLGQEFTVRAKVLGEMEFTDFLSADLDEDGKLTIVVEGLTETKKTLSVTEIIYGSEKIAPAVLAQAQADYQAKHGIGGILGSGLVMTSEGKLGVSWGMGAGPQPRTGLPPGLKPVADATAIGAKGMVHRIQLHAYAASYFSRGRRR